MKGDLEAHVGTSPFLARKASLLAWKKRFESTSGMFLTSEKELIEENEFLDNLMVQEFSESSQTGGNMRHLSPSRNKPMSQHDFTALETYLKRKFVTGKTTGSVVVDSKMEAMKVLDWMRQLPEKSNLEEFLVAFGIPLGSVDLNSISERLKSFMNNKLIGTSEAEINFADVVHIEKWVHNLSSVPASAEILGNSFPEPATRLPATTSIQNRRDSLLAWKERFEASCFGKYMTTGQDHLEHEPADFLDTLVAAENFGVGLDPIESTTTEKDITRHFPTTPSTQLGEGEQRAALKQYLAKVPGKTFLEKKASLKAWKNKFERSSAGKQLNKEEVEKGITTVGEPLLVVKPTRSTKNRKVDFEVPIKPSSDPQWKEVVGRMRELKDGDELEKWLDSLDVPHNVPKAQAKAAIRRFFMHDTWDEYKGAHLNFSLSQLV